MLTSMRRRAAGAAGAATMAMLMSLSTAAMAADDETGRYSMTPVEGGFARLDRETGAVSICTGKDGQWACSPVAEKQQQLERRIKELESENRQLKAEEAVPRAPSAAAPEGAPGGSQPPGDATPPTPPGNLPMPTEKDVDKLFDYVEGMVKKFNERIDRLEKEAQKDGRPL